MNPADAERLGLRDHEKVAVRIHGTERELVFRDVIVRVQPSFRLQFHLDTDEANAAGIVAESVAEILN